MDVFIDQAGDENSATLSRTGNGDGLPTSPVTATPFTAAQTDFNILGAKLINQSGDDNSADVVQTLDSNFASVDQSGNNNTATSAACCRCFRYGDPERQPQRCRNHAGALGSGRGHIDQSGSIIQAVDAFVLATISQSGNRNDADISQLAVLGCLRDQSGRNDATIDQALNAFVTACYRSVRQPQ